MQSSFYNKYVNFQFIFGIHIYFQMPFYLYSKIEGIVERANNFLYNKYIFNTFVKTKTSK